MNISLDWIDRLIEGELPPVKEVEKALIALGFEVEFVTDTGASYKDLIVGKVLSREQHPDADRLSVTKVFDGREELQVVCGAPNVVAGQTVVFAPVGSILPGDEGKNFKIKKSKIRGVESLGMICAEDEVGLGDAHEGILLLDDSLQAGTALVDLPGFYDTVLELDVTPNRPDALSHIGIARELCARFGLKLKIPELPLVEDAAETASRVVVEIEPDCGCTRYVARIVEGVKVGPSPAWMKRLLLAVGLRPINNVVDVTNFVLHEWGQPLHSFDLDRVKSGGVKVRKAKSGERLKTLDGEERKLQAADLLICDGDEAACVAGVMGGVSTEVHEGTQSVLLETAWFAPAGIRRTSRRLGLISDSSYRFERGINPFLQGRVSDYAAALLAEVCGGKILKGRVDVKTKEHKTEPTRVSLRPSRVECLLGMVVEKGREVQLLESIGIEKVAQKEDEIEFWIPGFRPDLEREVDLVEEVGRLVGYDEIPTIYPAFELRENPLARFEQVARKVRGFLATAGLNETVSLRFCNENDLETIFAEGDLRRDAVKLLNPLSEDWGCMPTSHLPGILRSVSKNARNQQSFVRHFEVARCYFPEEEKRDYKRNPGIREVHVLAGVLAGEWETNAPVDNPRQVDFLDLKTVLQGLLSILGLVGRTIFCRPEKPESFLHPNCQAEVLLDGKHLGYAGELHPAVEIAMDVRLKSVVFELDFELLEKESLLQPVFTAFSAFGEVSRELSMLVDEELDHGSLLEKIFAEPVKNMVDVRLRSVYRGKGVPEGKKSVLYQIIYQSDKATLTDKQVNSAQIRLAERLGEDEAISYR